MTTTVRIRVQSEGQSFGCVGVVEDMSGRRLATTRVYPHGMRNAAHQGAEALCEQRGWTIAAEAAS